MRSFERSSAFSLPQDGLGRISRRTVNAGSTGVATTYGYLAGGHGANSATPLVQTITQSGTTLTYAYDDAGNIISVSDGSKTISYEYDLLGQLTRVNDPYDTTAGSTGTTWKYEYDQGGNIQSKTAYVFTTGTVGSAVKTDSFIYGDANWKDKLTAFNGKTITYDAIGNPTNDGTWNYTWIGGRQMRAMYKDEFGEQGYDEITFEYNEEGLRTKKTRMYYDDATGDIGYKATNYTLHGKNIVHMSDGSNNLHFFYDAQNKPAVVVFNDTAYAYLYNLQGDVIGLVDSNGTKMVSYTYDAWGKQISKTGTLASTLGTIQPFRYRGYAYDEETSFYYLNQRYYNPLIERFVSPDAVSTLSASPLALTDKNLFAYCDNNPIMRKDDGGAFWDVFLDVVSLVSSVAEVIANPTSPSAWIGLAADVVCTVVPGLTGGGAVVDILVKGDDVVKTAKALNNSTGAANVFRKFTGSYEILYKSGKNYVGKGGFGRAIKSAERYVKRYGDEVLSINWTSAASHPQAFIEEYMRMKVRGVNNPNTYNMIWSPGRGYYEKELLKLFK